MPQFKLPANRRSSQLMIEKEKEDGVGQASTYFKLKDDLGEIPTLLLTQFMEVSLMAEADGRGKVNGKEMS